MRSTANRRFRFAPKLVLIVGACQFAFGPNARAHDIPNARVDRSIQVTLLPGKIAIDYEVGLAELTLTQDLRNLVGALPGGDRSAWFDRYGEVTGPLNAKGFLISADGNPIDLEFEKFDLFVEEHPRYVFRLVASLPAAARGRVSIRDTNYSASEGTSRLAIRGAEGVTIDGDDLPPNVAEIPIRPVWQLSDKEEERTKGVVAGFINPIGPSNLPPATTPVVRADSGKPGAFSSSLTGLLDADHVGSILWIGLMSIVLGAAHAIQPGHGKTLIVAASAGGRARSVGLGTAFILSHLGSVLLIALGLWISGLNRFESINDALARVSGFSIAVIGTWRLGRYLGKASEEEELPDSPRYSTGDLLFAAGAAGMLPCWDAVALVVLSATLGRLGLGLFALIGFSAGMASVLFAIAMAANRLRSVAAASAGWERALGIAGGAVLSMIGIAFLVV